MYAMFCFTVLYIPQPIAYLCFPSHFFYFLNDSTCLDLDTYAGVLRDYGHGHGQYQCIYVFDSNLICLPISLFVSSLR